MLLHILLLCGFLVLGSKASDCDKPSITTASGTRAPAGKYCPGDLIFEDDFDDFDLDVWAHQITLGPGSVGNWEFQWYTNNRSNSYAEGGFLNIKPTLVADHLGEDFLYSGTIDLNVNFTEDNRCTDDRPYACVRSGNSTHILNPIESARIRTYDSFYFRYGRIEVRAKIPQGDWLWPAIWLMPRWNVYSPWPVSGEVDIMESRGNLHLTNLTGFNEGIQKTTHTLHWGPNSEENRWRMTYFETFNDSVGYHEDFHKYQMEWDENEINFYLDDVHVGSVYPPPGGFWELGKFNDTGLDNPWINGTKMAPFDEEFYIILNVACGGTSFFSDSSSNLGGKPWQNSASNPQTQFWEGRDQWLPTWINDEYIFKIDYVKVWAL